MNLKGYFYYVPLKDLFFKKYHNKKFISQKLCIDEGPRKDTAGALYLLRNILKKFVLMNGDTFDIDMNELFTKI